jgi:adenine-specific DNA-methyltransferase
MYLMELDTVVCMEALDFLRGLPDGSVSLIATDPPYMGVKDEEWDNQWKDRADYLGWLRSHLEEFRRALAPNGSLYLFASPQMAAHVEIAIGDYFNVLNRITWKKPPYATKAEMFDKDSMRAYFPVSEAIIFAEQMGCDKPYQDALIDGNSTYWGVCESSKRSIFGDYLTTEFDRANVTRKQIAALFPSATGGLTGCVSNWTLGYNCPTPDQYQKMRDYLNGLNGHSDYLRREYEDLRREYEDLRREYEDLRREYEDLRRPFNVTDYDAYTDVWTFRTVQAYPGKHPCEKPLDLMRQIIKSSSREGDIVLDPFIGSGTTAVAARNLGRHFIGCDISPEYVAIANKRLALPYTPPLL